MNEKTVAGSMTNKTVLDGLLMYTEYSMVILAFNAAGNGPNTTVPIKARTEEGSKWLTNSWAVHCFILNKHLCNIFLNILKH